MCIRDRSTYESAQAPSSYEAAQAPSSYESADPQPTYSSQPAYSAIGNDADSSYPSSNESPPTSYTPTQEYSSGFSFPPFPRPNFPDLEPDFDEASFESFKSK